MNAFIILLSLLIGASGSLKTPEKTESVQEVAYSYSEEETQTPIVDTEPQEDYSENDEVTVPETDVEEEMTLEEKYQHNQERQNQEDEEDVWYDVPECEVHDFTVSEYSDGDGYGIEYICNKCGYSYTEPITEEEFLKDIEQE